MGCGCGCGGGAVLTWQLRVVVVQRERAARVLAAVAARAAVLVVGAHCHTRRNITESSQRQGSRTYLMRRLIPPERVETAKPIVTYAGAASSSLASAFAPPSTLDWLTAREATRSRARYFVVRAAKISTSNSLQF